MYLLRHWWLRLEVQVECQLSYLSSVFRFVLPYLFVWIEDHPCWLQLYHAMHTSRGIYPIIAFAINLHLCWVRINKIIHKPMTFMDKIIISKFQLYRSVKVKFMDFVNPNI